MASPSDIPAAAKGEIILNAHLIAAPGQADKLQKHLVAIRKYSLSPEEPGCLEYRTTRSYVTDGAVKFAVFERYTGVDALHAHFATDAFKAMIAEAEKGLLTGPPLVEYYYEFE